MNEQTNLAADRLRLMFASGIMVKGRDKYADDLAEALDTARQQRREDDPAMEALRHLFFVMERLDRQAGPTYSADHMVKITAETWQSIVRPAIQQVRVRLDAIAGDGGDRP